MGNHKQSIRKSKWPSSSRKNVADQPLSVGTVAHPLEIADAVFKNKHMQRINLNQIQIGSEIIHNGNVLKVTSITDKHTYKGAWLAKTAVCSCSIKTERGTQVTAFVPFVLCPDEFYRASEEYSI